MKVINPRKLDVLPAIDERFDTTLLRLDEDVEELEPPFYEFEEKTESQYLNVVPEISFQLIRGRLVSFKQLQAITVGRCDRHRNIQPAFDLAFYKGRELGVSRHHAQISYYQGKFNVIDLDSANGTKINGVRLKPNMLYPINERDLISFGLLQVYVERIEHITA